MLFYCSATTARWASHSPNLGTNQGTPSGPFANFGFGGVAGNTRFGAIAVDRTSNPPHPTPPFTSTGPPIFA